MKLEYDSEGIRILVNVNDASYIGTKQHREIMKRFNALTAMVTYAANGSDDDISGEVSSN